MVYRYANLNGSSTTSIDPVCDVSTPKRHLRTKVPLNNRAQTDSDAKLVVREILDHGCKAALFERKPYTIVVLISKHVSLPPVFAPCLCPLSLPLVSAPGLCPWSLPLVSAPGLCPRTLPHRTAVVWKLKSSGEIIFDHHLLLYLNWYDVQINGLISWIGLRV
jgi:hypothetical protein